MSEIVSKVYTAKFAVTQDAVVGDERKIKGIASTPSADREGDVVLPTGAKFKVPFPLLSAHDHSKPIGTVTRATATPNGIEIEAQLAPQGVAGFIDDAWALIKSGLMTGLSIGFRPLIDPVLTAAGRIFSSYEVFELSVCTVPMNAGANITYAKSHIQGNSMPTINKQLLAAVSKHWATEVTRTVERKLLAKAVIPATSTTTASALYYPTQAPGVLLPPVTPSLITALANGGAPQLPPNTRLVTQAALLTASEVPEGDAYPAGAPSLAFTLTDTERKFGLIMTYTRDMLAASNYDSRVQDYVQGQLEAAADNATDGFLVGIMTAEGTAATSVAQALASFAGDLRSAVWIASPETLASLQDAANPNVGPAGGVYRTLPALATNAAPDNKLFLLDRKRVAVYDGALIIEQSDEASIVLDTAPGTPGLPVAHLFQEGLVALKITKYADSKLLSAPHVITLA
ncbi:HK97 family phage prohead protease [Caballeronia sordidicola]|uniref:Phage capsid n=1 Tax=Caballeronia sordidicola TaxID=196367 RepID=A0A226X6R4_CABSO|nr:HK97 family phage prohead protease [Caballeronia sordidicola]OXC78538.1 Phage capsid [Caballeronia sordidicola]